jgi:hypothetical protein
VGLNFVLGCHKCRQRVWMFRGEEVQPMHNFWRAHWKHEQHLELSQDQTDANWVYDYEDVGQDHGVKP